MQITKVFQTGDCQAVRIPEEMRTDKEEFYIRRISEGCVIYPVDDPWVPLRQTLGTFPQDFMADREQPEMPEWEEL